MPDSCFTAAVSSVSRVPDSCFAAAVSSVSRVPDSCFAVGDGVKDAQ